jgi:hypothetical protein
MMKRKAALAFVAAAAVGTAQPAAAGDRATFSGAFRIEMQAPAERTLTLFDPVGEAAWAAGWAPVFARAADRSALPDGTVFVTHDHGDRPTIWVLQRYDRVQREIAYVNYAPDEAVVAIHISVRDRAAGTSEAEVRYDLVAATPAGDALVQSFGSRFPHMQPHWQQAIDAALAR